MRLLLAAASTAIAAQSVSADLLMSEIYWNNDSGVADWFELTNTGTTAISTAGLFYDDDSADATKDDGLSSLTIGAGESVVFLVSWEDDFASSADAIRAFNTEWSYSGAIGFVDGGSGLGGGGDAAYVFDGNGDSANVLTFLEYPDTDTIGDAATWTPGGLTTSGSTSLSGVLGTPGVIPAPGALALLGLAGLGRRRRG